MTSLRGLASWRTSSANAQRRQRLCVLSLLLALLAAACGSSEATSDSETGNTSEATSDSGTSNTSEATSDSSPRETVLRIGAIPDQEPERLQRTYELLSDYLESALPDVTVEYVPVTEYQAAVTGFRVGDLDVVWFGGLTGVQARLEVEGANAIAQRDIDEAFTSVFIANTSAAIEPFTEVAGLSVVAGHSFTFGSESSTSGRLMPQSFLDQAGVDVETSFTGAPGFSGSHDATIELVEAGTFEVGALNSQVWDDRVAEGAVDTSVVVEIFRTPTYFDYHWVAQPDLNDRFGAGFSDAFVAALAGLDGSNPDHAAILELFGAGSFIVTENGNYAAIEEVGRASGLIR